MSHDLSDLIGLVSRRHLLATASAVSLASPFARQAAAAQGALVPPTDDRMFGRAKSVIFLWLSGGPPQHETFDPKPLAPAEIRGPFQPISTNVPGIQYCELLPRIALMADKLAVVRSLYTNNNIHGGSGYWILTGRPMLTGDGENPKPDDWPYMGSIVKMLKPSERLPAMTSVTLPEIFIGNGGNLEAGQFGGFLGPQWTPEILRCNPADRDFRLAGDYESKTPRAQLDQRIALLEQLGATARMNVGGNALGSYAALQRQAFDLLGSSAAREAFALDKESPETRDRYGRRHWGQSVLLARRLVEAGVRFVSVNWPRVPGDRGVDNPLWDTHARNFDRMEDCLAPQFDQGFTALIDDLDQRGLLADTLVVAVGEFGRTPQVNANAGRDHWGGVFSAVLAGAGIAGGQVFGSSDKQGAYPATEALNAGYLTATIFHLLGINPQGTFLDREGRALSLCESPAIYRILGEGALSPLRTASTGDVNRVPEYSPDPLLEQRFSLTTPPLLLDAPASPKGWRASRWLTASQFGLGVALEEPLSKKISGCCAQVGLLGGRSPADWKLNAKEVAVLAQQIRDPQAGKYVVTLSASGIGSRREFYEAFFRQHFRTRLVLFQFSHSSKSAAQRIELASIEIRPNFTEPGSEPQSFVLENYRGNPGANFTFGLGIGMAVIVERITEGELDIPAGEFAALRIDSARVDFEGQKV